MLPTKLRFWLFDTLSVQPMRYVEATPMAKATGLTRQVFEMINEDFFRNGSLTSRSAVPELMAAIWVGGRESMLVPDKVDRTTKDAISAILSRLNECPYCEDMLISLVHAGGAHEAANKLFSATDIDDSADLLNRRMEWIKAISLGKKEGATPVPFTDEQLPEIIGTIMGMHDINRFSHVVMSDSPVSAPFGLQTVKAWALRLFGKELEATRRLELEPGRSLALLPAAELPEDMDWAQGNTRIADAVARWTATVERESSFVITDPVRHTVTAALARWDGRQMPLSSTWIEEDLGDLSGTDRSVARFALLVAKASYRITESMVMEVLGERRDQDRFVRILAWSSFSAARRLARILADRIAQQPQFEKIQKRPATLAR